MDFLNFVKVLKLLNTIGLQRKERVNEEDALFMEL